jgi:3-deoxy-7-phosphoheptulonate synthase
VIIVLKQGATEQDIAQIEEKLTEHGYQPNVTRGVEDTVIAAIGAPQTDEKSVVAPQLQAFESVEKVIFVSKPYKLVSRECHPTNTAFEIGGRDGGERVLIGGEQICVMAGPCSVETHDQLMDTAQAVRGAGATVLRGGAYKPRTSPYDFQGWA